MNDQLLAAAVVVGAVAVVAAAARSPPFGTLSPYKNNAANLLGNPTLHSYHATSSLMVIQQFVAFLFIY